jgi:hypothetical protein
MAHVEGTRKHGHPELGLDTELSMETTEVAKSVPGNESSAAVQRDLQKLNGVKYFLFLLFDARGSNHENKRVSMRPNG